MINVIKHNSCTSSKIYNRSSSALPSEMILSKLRKQYLKTLKCNVGYFDWERKDKCHTVPLVGDKTIMVYDSVA